MKHLTIILAFLMMLSTQANAQVSNEYEYVCNKWSQMGAVETTMTRLIHASKPFVLVSDGSTLSFKNAYNNPVVASRLGNHTPEIDLYSAVNEYGSTTVFYFYQEVTIDKDTFEVSIDPDIVELRQVGLLVGDLLRSECFKR